MFSLARRVLFSLSAHQNSLLSSLFRRFFFGYRESFVCVEPGYVSEFFSLEVGKEWVGKMVLKTF